jgi:pyruvate/2-oxoglutarate dehydrogenase complex dihydrolipoamide acyltransferase (E2) component
MSPQTGPWVPNATSATLREEALGRSGPTAVVPQLTLTTAVDASELLLFRRDLRSSLEAVVVCAIGRALSAHPEVNVTVAERVDGPALVPAASPSVRLLVLCDGGIRAGAVDAGETRPLKEVRDAVTALVEDLRSGRPTGPAQPSALSLTTFVLSGATTPSAVAPPTSCALAVGRLAGETGILPVGLSVDARVIDAGQASGFLSTVVRLLEHPYRRLR